MAGGARIRVQKVWRVITELVHIGNGPCYAQEVESREAALVCAGLLLRHFCVIQGSGSCHQNQLAVGSNDVSLLGPHSKTLPCTMVLDTHNVSESLPLRFANPAREINQILLR